jgi:hypothetical protein
MSLPPLRRDNGEEEVAEDGAEEVAVVVREEEEEEEEEDGPRGPRTAATPRAPGPVGFLASTSTLTMKSAPPILGTFAQSVALLEYPRHRGWD